VILCGSTLPTEDTLASLPEGGGIALLVPERLERDAVALATPVSDGDVLVYGDDAGLGGALRALGRSEVQHVLVEPGPRLLTSLWDDSLIEQLVLVHAGGMAGEEAPALYRGSAQADTSELVRDMVAVEAGLVGGDAATVWEPV
jgi:riboflavin biosynthesis pyrimidine reductase